jgi:hypothetical protein
MTSKLTTEHLIDHDPNRNQGSVSFVFAKDGAQVRVPFGFEFGEEDSPDIRALWAEVWVQIQEAVAFLRETKGPEFVAAEEAKADAKRKVAA